VSLGCFGKRPKLISARGFWYLARGVSWRLDRCYSIDQQGKAWEGLRVEPGRGKSQGWFWVSRNR
jgi:hypothetical protein